MSDLALSISQLKPYEQIGLNRVAHWIEMARPDQLPPAGDWWGWFLCAGRGAGKTRTGAESLFWWAITQPNTVWGVVAPTQSDLERTCFEGESGLLAVIPEACFKGGSREKGYNSTDKEITLANGSIILGFSAEKPERLRGPNLNGAWADELAGWNKGGKTRKASADDDEIKDRAQYTWDMLSFCLRKGDVRVVISSTPKPTKLIKDLLKSSDIVVTKATTHDNKANLSPKFFQKITKYEGTRIGQQEIYAVLLEDMEGIIFQRKWFKLWPYDRPLPYFEYIIQSYDTAYKEESANDPTACTTWGVFSDPHTGWRAMLIDAWSERLIYPDLKPRVIKEFNEGRYGENDKRADIILIEEKSSGISLIQDLQRAELPVTPYNPGRASKLERANVVSYLPAREMIYIPESRATPGRPMAWADDWMNELCQFNGVDDAHDDYVDSTSQAWLLMSHQGYLTVKTGYEEDEEEIIELPKENPYG